MVGNKKLLKDYKLQASSENGSNVEFINAYDSVCRLLNRHEWDNLVQGRFSFNFIVGLVDRVLNKKNIGRIIGEIRYLEGKDDVLTVTKPETLFEYDLLKGLWHKHYNNSDINSLYFNLIKPLDTRAGRNRAKDEIKAVLRQSGKLNSNNLTLANEITQRVFSNYYSKIIENKEVTGEWVIYHVHDNEKYYLALGEHNSNHAELAKNIKFMCGQEFPEFRNEIPLFEF